MAVFISSKSFNTTKVTNCSFLKGDSTDNTSNAVKLVSYFVGFFKLILRIDFLIVHRTRKLNKAE